MLIQAAISRSREFAADAGGAAIAGIAARAGERAPEDRGGVAPCPARRQPGHGPHVHHQAVLGRRPDVALQHASADRAAHPGAACSCPGCRTLAEQPLSTFRFKRVWPAGHARSLIRADFTAGLRLAPLHVARRRTRVHVDDLDISPSKIGETAQRIVDRAIEEARRREHALLTNEHSVPGVRAGRVGHVRRGDARRRAESAHHPPGHRGASAHDAVVRPAATCASRRRPSSSSSWRSTTPAAPAGRRSKAATCSRPCSRKPRACRSRSCAATASSPTCSCRG